MCQDILDRAPLARAHHASHLLENQNSDVQSLVAALDGVRGRICIGFHGSGVYVNDPCASPLKHRSIFFVNHKQEVVKYHYREKGGAIPDPDDAYELWSCELANNYGSRQDNRVKQVIIEMVLLEGEDFFSRLSLKPYFYVPSIVDVHSYVERECQNLERTRSRHVYGQNWTQGEYSCNLFVRNVLMSIA